jgi:hypothetical protein
MLGKPNKYRGTCFYCGGSVSKNAGVCWRPEGSRTWHVAHLACQDAGAPEVIEARFSDGCGGYSTMKVNRRGRCEDAPCCGCCD